MVHIASPNTLYAVFVMNPNRCNTEALCIMVVQYASLWFGQADSNLMIENQ